MTLTAEIIGTLIGVLTFLAAVARYLIHAWQKGVTERKPDPASVTVDTSLDLVKALYREIERLQVELDRVRILVKALEDERDAWRDRAINLGYEEMK